MIDLLLWLMIGFTCGLNYAQLHRQYELLQSINHKIKTLEKEAEYIRKLIDNLEFEAVECSKCRNDCEA